MALRSNYDGYELAELLEQELVGKRITKITDEKIVLDNGTVLLIEPNEGCGGCSAGWAEMDIDPYNPNIEAAVMNVEYKDTDDIRSDSFKIFIYMTDNTSITMEGNNGNDNGYYGSGFWVTVTR
jgi:hypothetical protein